MLETFGVHIIIGAEKQPRFGFGLDPAEHPADPYRGMCSPFGSCGIRKAPACWTAWGVGSPLQLNTSITSVADELSEQADKAGFMHLASGGGGMGHL